MSGYEFDPKDKDGSLRDRFDCYCKEVIGRAAHNLVFKQAQYLILHFGGGEIDPSMMMHEDEHDKPHWDCILMTDNDYALGDELEIKIIGVFKRADFDHKYIVAESHRNISDYTELSADEKEELSRLYPRIGEGEGWFGKEEAEFCIKNHRKEL